jgi:GNAT superfamily N-acetyltransferase
MDIRIRHSVREDCPRLLELVRELAEFERAPAEVTVTPEHFEASGFGDRPVWWGLSATTADAAGERIVGFALYYIRFSTWKGQSMYLEDILVTQSMRGHGIGGLLFEELIREARRKKLERIVWQVLEWNEDAMRFYRKYAPSFDAEWVNCSIRV